MATVEHPGMPEPMLVAYRPGGGNLSIEFTDDAPGDAFDNEHPAWGRGWNYEPRTRLR